MLTPLIPTLTSSPTIVTSLDLGGMIANNTTIAYLVVVSLLSHPPLQTNPANGTIRATSIGGKANGEEESHLESIVGYLEVLRHLPPTLPSFDLMGRLLKDGRVIPDYSGGGTNLELSGGSDYMGSTRTGSGGGCDEGGNTTIADLISLEVLGWFIHSCVEWLGRWEEEERTGGRFDGGFGIGVRNVSVPPYDLGYTHER